MKASIAMTMEIGGAQQNKALNKLNQMEGKLDHINKKL
jgi:hypothetical protein